MTTLIFVVALLILAGLYISRPLLVAHAGIPKPMTQRERLLAQKTSTMARIRDLDYDVETGKIPEAEHRRLREPLLAAAAGLLQQIDALDSRLEKKITSRRVASGESRLKVANSPTRQPANLQTPIDNEIEAAVARLRQSRDQAAPAGSDQVRFCSQCGHAATAQDRFCAACGSKLREMPVTT